MVQLRFAWLWHDTCCGPFEPLRSLRKPELSIVWFLGGDALCSFLSCVSPNPAVEIYLSATQWRSHPDNSTVRVQLLLSDKHFYNLYSCLPWLVRDLNCWIMVKITARWVGYIRRNVYIHVDFFHKWSTRTNPYDWQFPHYKWPCWGVPPS